MLRQKNEIIMKNKNADADMFDFQDKNEIDISLMLPQALKESWLNTNQLISLNRMQGADTNHSHPSSPSGEKS